MTAHDVAVFGAANVDLMVRPGDAAIEGISNPAEMLLRLGGAGRNIAAGLAALGKTVELVTALGEDSDGRAIADDCATRGVELTWLPVKGRTGRYVAILDPDGDLGAAYNDMAIHELTEELPNEVAERSLASRWWFTDANLSSELLEDIALKADRPALAVAAVSTPKAVRLAGLLDRIDLLVLNRQEAEALLRHPAGEGTLDEVRDLAAGLLRKGPSIVAVTASGAGAVIALEGKCYAAPALDGTVTDTVGAGDAFAAGLLSALLDGEGPESWLARGLAAASIVIAESETVPDSLGMDDLLSRAADVTVTMSDCPVGKSDED